MREKNKPEIGANYLKVPVAVGRDSRLLEISEGQVRERGAVRWYRRLLSQCRNVNFRN